MIFYKDFLNIIENSIVLKVKFLLEIEVSDVREFF